MGSSEETGPDAAQQAGPGRLEDAAEAASSAVRQAAEVLEEQLSAGLVGVSKVASGFAQNRRVDEAAFHEVVDRLRSSSHEMLDVAAGRVSDMAAPDVQGLTERFAQDAHSMFDALLNLAAATPEIINRLAGKMEQGTTSGPATDQPVSDPGAS